MGAPNPVHLGAPNLRLIGGNWTWNKPRRTEHFRRCNYCGSMNPEDLLAEPNWRAEWADRKYGWPHKFYVQIPDRLGILDYFGSCNRDMSDEEIAHGGWKRVEDLTAEELEIARPYIEDINAPDRYGAPPRMPIRVVKMRRRTHHLGKFYTEHLADPNISQDAKATIHRISGLVFDWLPDGRVAWRPYEEGHGNG